MIASMLVAVLALAAPAAGPKKGPGVVPLVKLGAGVPPAWSDALLKAVQGAEAKGGQTWVAPPAVSLDEAQAALGCSTWNDACAGQVASMTGAASAFVVEVKSAEGGGDVSAHFVNASGSGKGAAKRMHLDALDAGGLELAKALVEAAAAEKDIAFLVVDTENPGADVSVDGAPVKGKTPWAKPLPFPAGKHSIAISQEGRAPLQFEVDLAPFELRKETKSLGSAGPDKAPDPVVGDPPKPDPPPADPVPPQEEGLNLAYVGYAAAGIGGVVALVGAGLTTAWTSGYVEASQESEANKKLRRCVGLCTDDGLGLGISGSARKAFINGQYSAWLGGSAAVLGVGAIVTGIGVYLALTSDPAE